MGSRRSLRQRGGPLAMAALLALGVASTAAAGLPASGSERRAQLDGRPISLADVARFACHDRDFPVIRCFASAAERDRDMAELGRSAELVSVTAYVTWYADANYGGTASFTALWSEPDLTSYGWNDKISGNGSTLTSVQRTRWPETYVPCYSGTISQDPQWGGVGQWSYRSFVQADFSFVCPPIGGHWFPWLDMTATAAGGMSGSGGGT